MAFSDQVILRSLRELIAQRGENNQISQKDIAEASGASVDTVQRATRRLSASGRIIVTRHKRRGYTYRIPDEQHTT